jgi:protein TonB
MRWSLLFLLFICGFASAQVCSLAAFPKTQDTTETRTYCITEVMPLLLIKTNDPEGNYRQQAEQQLLHFIYSNLCYPAISRESAISGTIVVSFTITAEGLIDPASITCPRDIGGGFGDEGKRIIHLMADLGWQWVPASQGGKDVAVRYNLPIRICLK